MRRKNDQILRRSSNFRGYIKGLIPSRIEPLGLNIFILRDDLLGLPFNGSKHRKYSGLFRYLFELSPSQVLIPASLASNHLLLSVFYCKKEGLKPLVLTTKPYGPLRPNAEAVLKLLQEDEICYVKDPLKEAQELHLEDEKAFLMPLGGFHKESALSALSLGYEIMDFHDKTPIDTLFVDAGTGLQASSCLMAMQERGFSKEAIVVCMGPLDFDSVLDQVALWTEKTKPTFKIRVCQPMIGKRYGSIPKEIKTYQLEFFKKHGISLDAFYNAKLFYTAEKMMEKDKLGTCLIVHSGGTYSL